MTLRKDFDQGLEQLNKWLVEMGEMVEVAVEKAINSLKENNPELADEVIADDVHVNDMEEKILELGLKLIATQQPVAKDLRRIIAAFRIANDLERMGDLALDIAKAVHRLQGEPLIKPIIDIPRMGEIIRNMTYEAIQAYVNENVDLAYKMAKDDDQVDALYGQITRELVLLMMENPRNIAQAQILSFVGRYIERFGDHATNIGESVVYLVTGKRPDLNA
ncbi:phosphate transport system regulatory protein PhoU [Paenibacillus montaniterrae]|uniref:Phosphate-specific transport system accessory protein PhoU n=1 Tax=Paenibacillus montaniterrae TaxID=429341 RepID=A0A920CWP7_9BACL|nr:phosphate signaling complex protein PhoU [Paenibacillus montaniterrae]GIP15470.1 phosphate transport system regulatory protein PhoU [Paenibacillus montaniterrae]